MEKEGAGREDIWKKTGWRRGPDGKLRFEVDVDKMQFKNWPGIRNFGDAHFEWGKTKKTDLRLSDVLDYPSLFKAYPFLRYLKLSELATTNAFGESTGNKGFYIEDRRTVGIVGNTGEKETRSILLHELQHAIQDREGFALGGSLGVPEVRERAEKEISDTLEEANKQLMRLTDQRDEYLKAHKGEKDDIRLVDDFMEQNPEWEKDFDSAFALRRTMSSAVEKKIKIQKAYSSLAGEVESFIAPMSVNRTKAEKMLREFKTEQMPKGTRTREESELVKERAKLRRLIAMNRPEKDTVIREAMESGKFTGKDIARIREEAKVPYLQRGIQTLPLYESLKVFKAANDKEKAIIRAALRKKIVNARKSYSREEWKAVKSLFDGLRSQIYN